MKKLLLGLLLLVSTEVVASVNVVVNGTTYAIPQTNEKGWGAAVTSWIQAISSSTLQPSGGAFTLTSDLDFGASFGIKSLYVKSETANISTAGVLRLAVSDSIGWRNNANGGNLLLLPNASDGLKFNSIDLVNVSTAQTLTNKTLTTPVISTISNTGTVTLPTATDTLVGKATTDTLTNKTLTGNTAVNLVSGSGTLTLNTSGTVTVPNATDTLVGKATTDTLTNKTLTGNTAVNLISGSGTLALNTSGTATVPNATDTLVGKATTDTLTNKSISGSTNTITNVSLTAGVTGTLPIANGGTNLTSYAAGDLPYASATNVLSKLAATSNGFVLTLAAGLPSWAAVSVTPTAANAQSGNYTLLTTDSTVNFTTSTSSLTATLPTAVGNSGKRFTINKVDDNTGKVTINTTSAQTIGSWALASGIILEATKGDTITVESDGANWQIVNWGITVAAKQQDTSGFSVANDNALHTVTMGTRIIDTYQCFGSGTCTIIIPGTYQLSFNANFSSASWTATDQVRAQITVNGAAAALVAIPLNVTASYVVPVQLTTIATLAAGDTITAQLKQNDAGARTLDTGAGQNTISVVRVGN